MKRNLYYLLLCVLLLSACSGAKYGHYGYVKRSKTPIAKEKRDKKQRVSLDKTDNIYETILNTAESPTVSDSIPNTFQANSEAQQRNHTTQNELVQPKKRIEKKHEAKITLEPKREIIQKVDAKPRHNDTANTALILSLAAIFSVLLGFAIPPFVLLAFLVGSALGIAAFVTSIIALSEIKKKPDDYTNKGAAIFALIIGSLFILGTILMLIYLVFFLVLIFAMFL